tara:strand:- start:621 stop:1544 length:924 start_codon:yes stop_codon:yes gene_type:complete
VATQTTHKYLYNGKELQDELSLILYSMDLRQLDPSIARWTSVDPVVHFSLSQYNAFDNNPAFYADPNGGNSLSRHSGNTIMLENQARNEAKLNQMQSAGSNPANALLVNHANSGLGVMQLAMLANHAGDIFYKNGIEEINFKIYTPEKFDADEMDFNDAMLNIVSHGENVQPGNSRISPSYGTIDTDPSNTYLNVTSYKFSSVRDESSRLYKLGYTLAHEILHQYIRKADLTYWSTGIGYQSTWTHDNSQQNLNMEGFYAQVPGHAANYLRPAERILGYQRNMVRAFLKGWQPDKISAYRELYNLNR